MSVSDENEAIGQVTVRLAARFPDVDTDTIDQLVRAVHAEFDGRPIRDFVPILVEARARDELRGMRHRLLILA